MLNRRNILSAMVASAVGSTTLPLSSLRAAEGKKKRLPWRNWSGSQHCLPESRVAPANIEELKSLIESTTGTLRPVGAGHSFTPLVPTDGTIVSLARMSGLIDHDAEKLQATVWAGSRLGDIGQPLEDVGQALINMPDIDEQTLAGCIATATHGTGTGLGCMSTFVRGLQLIDGRGIVHDCDADNKPELFKAALVSLGSLGIITQVKLQNIAPHRLRRETHWHSFEDLIESADKLADKHRNFEFYYFPFSGMGFTDTHDFTDEPVGATEKIDGNEGVMDLKLARDLMKNVPKVRELVLGSYIKTLESEVTVESSWKNYASERNVRFNEMEYHLPREHALDALVEIRDALETRHPEVFFPIEFRYIKGDDIWLSPFYGRESCSIAVHRYFEEDFKPFFDTIEPIFRKYQGRPHWGKLNNLTREELREHYPHWDDFAAIRKKCDPQGRFLNPYLRSLFA
jgi:FAD-linked oxidoreductase